MNEDETDYFWGVPTLEVLVVLMTLWKAIYNNNGRHKLTFYGCRQGATGQDCSKTCS
jgi:hypothetical protein